jgi:integrase/recombinase XerD
MIRTNLYLDTRRVLRTGKYPLKLHVFESSNVRKYYPTGESLTEEEWKSIKEHRARSRELKNLHNRVIRFEARALEIIKNNEVLNLTQFDTLFTGRPDKLILVKNLYDDKIQRLLKRGQYGTATVYQSAINMIEKLYPDLTITKVTKDFLADLEHQLTLRPSTIGIYLRTLRTIYNEAIDKKLAKEESYPFGVKKYKIPTSTSNKRALTEEEKNKLINFKPEIKEWADALKVWKFSYFANGMNIADIAHLGPQNIQGDLLVYTRKKTAKTERAGVQQKVLITQPLKDLLKSGLFFVLDGKEGPEQQRKKITQWTKTTNKYLKRIGKALGIGMKLTTYTARHTFATVTMNNGARLAYIRDALGHSSIQTTENYLASLDLTEMRKWSNLL